MEELRNKLQSKDSTVVALLISKLVEYILEKYAIGEEATTEISFLKEESVSNDERISEIAFGGLSKLIENGIINSDKLLEELITLIPNSQVSHGIVRAISCALYHHVKGKNDEYLTKFNLHQPQHPFIILLNKDPEYLQYIYDEIKFSNDFKDTSYLSSSLHFSFYQFCICNPYNNESNFYKMKLWTNLIESSIDTKTITRLISWIPFDTSSSIQVTAKFLEDLVLVSLKDGVNINRQVLLILQISALYHLVSRNYSPRSTLKTIELLIDHMPIIDFANAILLLLVKCIISSSLAHIMAILQICEILISQPIVNVYVLESLKMSLLHWIGNPSSFSSKVVTKAGKMYLLIQHLLNTEREIDNKFPTLYKKNENLIISNKELYIACKLTIISNSWKNKDCALKFLSKLKNAEPNFIKQTIHLVFGLFASDLNDEEVVLSAFSIICVYLKNCEEFSHLVLTLILYKISNTSNSNVHFKLLQYLPELARTNENYLKIVTTINVLFSSADVVLKTLAMCLMFDLWLITNKSYPYLEDMLTSEVEHISSEAEFFINKAYTIKKICENNASIYGADMVAHLSRILSKCSREGEIASAIAIDAITVLCSEHIIDVETTWATIAPKCIDDGRTRTIESLLGLAAVMTNLLHPEEHAKLQEEVIRKVWYYVVENEDLRVKKAAFHALIEFGLDNISPYFPEQYVVGSQKPWADVMNTHRIPGFCWINFFENQSNLRMTGDFLVKMISKEIDEFPKSVYHVLSMKEPLCYSYLPVHSILRGVAEYCRLQMSKWREICKPVYIECLRILCQEYSKPLPPCNWWYLRNFLHESELRDYCVNLASHQVIISGTARRLMENYIVGLTANLANEAEVLLVYKNLKFLMNSIEPTILRPFFWNTLNDGINLFKEEHKKDFLTSMVSFLKDVLIDTNIQEVGKREIVKYIDRNIDILEASDEMFQIFSNCVINYPAKFLDSATNLLHPGEVTTETYERAVKIRCALALKPNESLKWMNDLIDIGTADPNLKFPLTELLYVVKLKKNQLENAKWVSDLFGRIEAAVGDSNKKGLLFLLDILIVSLVAFSGFHVMSDLVFQFQEYLLLFPQSTALLMDMEEWYNYSSKAMECLYYLNFNNKGLLPELYQNIFGQALQALRYHPEFKKNKKWMKYLSSHIHLENYL